MVILALKASGPCLLLDVLVLSPQCNWDVREFFGAFLLGVGNLFSLSSSCLSSVFSSGRGRKR